MSYYQGGNYQPPPSSRYQDAYAQYPQGQNGGYTNQQAPLPPPPPPQQQQYPGQPTYGQQQYGGPVQQSQGGYQSANVTSPRSTSFASSYQSQYQSPQTYNLRNYAQSPQQPQGQIPQYNPQNYASVTPAPYPSQYNPAAYPEPAASATSGPMGDPYAYSPSNHSSAGFPSPQQGSFRRSPQQPQYTSPHQQYSPQPPRNQFAQQTSPPPPQHSYPYQSMASSAQPSYIEMPYPSDDWQQQVRRQGSSAGQYTNISPALPGLTDGQYAAAPPYQPDNHQPPSPLYGTTSHDSSPSPPSSTAGPTPPAHGVSSRSNTLGRHPSQRPLPGLPEPQDESDYFQHGRQMSREEAESLNQDELFDQVEDAILNAGRPGRSPSIALTSPPYESHRTRQSFGHVSPRDIGMVNGHLSPVPSQPAQNDPYSDDSDPEAAAGLEAMRLAEEREAADDFRRQSGNSTQTPFTGYNSQRVPRRDSQRSPGSRQNGNRLSDGDDYSGVDVSMFEGGLDVHMPYGGDPSQLAAGGELNGDMNSQHSSMRRSQRSQNSSYDYNMDNIHPFPPFRDARVDAGGTGGNYEPPADGRRQSYDEGDEYTLMEGQMPERFPDEPPDVFFNSASATYRPLPPPPPGEGTPPTPQNDLKDGYPYAPNGYDMNAQGQWVPRSASLISYSKTPPVTQPLRSKTDAEERRLRQTARMSNYSTYETAPASASAAAIDLPSLPTRRFVPSKLGTPDFKKCEEPWAMSAILSWLMIVAKPEQTTELKESAIKEALVNLFTSKVPTMNIADAEGLSDRVAEDMHKAGALQQTEEWVRLTHVPMSGVIIQLTSSGCYSPTIHNHDVPGRCYSHHCQRTLKKVNLHTQPVRAHETWAEFYKLKKENIEGRDNKEIERQNVLHEIVQTEDNYMEQLNLLRIIYRDPLAKVEPSIISPKRKDKFLKDVFGKLEAVRKANEDHLLPQLKYRQHEQGPWVVGFSDIFRQWIRKAKVAYIEYASSFPGASFMVRTEMERNIQFAGFLDKARNDPRGKRLGWDTYLKSPITRLQRYTLLLHTVLKNMKTESEEKTNLQIAYDEVKAVTLDCDAHVAEHQRKVDLADLNNKLVLRPGMQTAVELNLTHLGRELVHRGDLQRMGGNRFTWLDSHTLLFDHYLVIAKIVAHRHELGGRIEKYDVSRLPIPMDLLVLESTVDPPVQKSSYVNRITTVSAVSGRSVAADQSALGRTQSNSPAPGLANTNTGLSSNSLHTVTSIDTGGKDSEKILYPIRIKHLGRENYTLFAHTEQARRDWCTKIIEAKTKHAKALYAQHAEPFRLRVMADSAFVYDAFAGTAGKTLVIKGTPIDRAIEEVEQRFKDTGRPGPICRARVNCATSFSMPYPGKQMVAVGTDFGVFVSEADNPRGWTKTISMTKVTQIAVLEEFNLFLLISDKSLIAYHLDVMTAGPASNIDSARKAPQKLSGSRDVGFFVAGRMKDRTLVFYKKRDNLSSTFKVLEPIYQKSSERKRAGFFKRGSTEFFREFDDFYIPTECSGINLFTSSLAVSTSRGFEVLSLERKVPQSVPEVQGESVQNIVRHIKDQRALCMLRLSEAEFLLCYAQCAVYVNKHGEISRSVIMEFVGTAHAAALSGAYLVLFDSDFIEIRNAQNGRLKQIIAGREVKCLDDGGEYNAGLNRPPGPTGNGSAYGSSAAGGRSVKAVMQHPENERTQIVVELLLNEEMKEG